MEPQIPGEEALTRLLLLGGAFVENRPLSSLSGFLVLSPIRPGRRRSRRSGRVEW